MKHHTSEHVYGNFITISNYQFGLYQQSLWGKWNFTYCRTDKGIQVIGSIQDLKAFKIALDIKAEIQNVEGI